MSDLLAVAGDKITDEELLPRSRAGRPDRVTVLAEEERDENRAASLVDESRSEGTDVVGLADRRSQLHGSRFDRGVGDNAPAEDQVQLTSRSTWS